MPFDHRRQARDAAPGHILDIAKSIALTIGETPRISVESPMLTDVQLKSEMRGLLIQALALTYDGAELPLELVKFCCAYDRYTEGWADEDDKEALEDSAYTLQMQMERIVRDVSADLEGEDAA